MLVADTHVGHRDDPEVAPRLADGHETVRVTPTERRRSRFRTTTDSGLDLGVVCGQDLRDGDVLDADGTLVVVALGGVTALAVDLGPDCSPTAGVAFGHALGNRHRDLVVRDGRVLVRADDHPDRVEATVRDLLPAGATLERTTVDPTLFDDGREHAHGDDAHSHAHDDSHALLDRPRRSERDGDERRPDDRSGGEP